ncbi:MAG: PilN domain-containing protein [Candidatus Pacebacteria bacterium]|nr:PilN domain-containing protein [Candidatus Paceibacterota bacterium]MDD5356875.1 PilN domain-containing protein [Candidatus Paceibacterota bacterium]
MLDFLPKEIKKFLKNEYALRVATLGFLLSFMLFVLYGAFLLPSFFLSQVKENVAVERAKPVLSSEDFQKSKSLHASLASLKKNLGSLKIVSDSSPLPTEVIDAALNRPSGIQIESFQYAKLTGSGALQIIGTASSRDAIVSYVKMLQSQRFFSKVDFPISNLASDKDINFTINATGTF